jgi:thioesterase domain-containing protein
VHPVTGIAWCYAGLPGLLGGDWPVYGLQSRAVDPAQPPYRDLTEMVDEYTRHIRSVQPDGPYHLLGWSLGGNVAHAIAARLEAAGERVALLALLDSYPPQGSEAAPTADEIVGYVEREGTIAVGQDVELGTALARAAANNVDIVDGAVPPDFAGDVLCFTATAQRAAEAPTASLWKHHVAGTVAEYDVDCTHLDMTRPEPLARIAAVIASAFTELG